MNLNPFDLPGPPFLLFYILLGALVLGTAWLQVHAAENAPPPPLPLSDPYQIAWLRGGTAEAARIAVVSLFDRGLIEIEGDRLCLSRSRSPPLLAAYPPLERAVLEAAGKQAPATAVFTDPSVRRACEEFRGRLEAMGLVPDAATKARRATWYGAAGLLLIGTGVVKLLVALARGRSNVAFLLFLMAAVAVTVVVLWTRRRTALGDRMVADLRALFAPQGARAIPVGGGRITSDTVLLAAVLGLAALPADDFAPLLTVYKKSASSGGGCGSSCGSGCGGGGGGGGGCGGCGSG